MFKEESVSASSRTSVWLHRRWVAAAALCLTGMYSLTVYGDHEVINSQDPNLNLQCVTVTFEGGGQNVNIHEGDPIPNTGIIFPVGTPGWRTLTSGLYSNNPSGVTVAIPVASGGVPPIRDFEVFFVDPVQTVSFEYSSLFVETETPGVTVTAFDIDGNPVGSDSGPFTNNSFPLTIWNALSVDAPSNVITRIVVAAHRGNTLIDDFKTCRQLDDPVALLETLINDVVALNLNQGIENSLDAKLDAILRALEDMNQNNFAAACNALQAFIHEVQAQSGKKILQPNADALIDSALKITDLLDCNEG